MNQTLFTVEQVTLHTDARGCVLEPVDQDALCRQGNTHLVITEPGAVRGNHFHRRGTEITVVLGPALVRIRQGDQPRDIAVPEGEAYRFVFPPGLPHAFQNTGTRPMILIAFNTVVHDPAAPDVVRETLIEPVKD